MFQYAHFTLHTFHLLHPPFFRITVLSKLGAIIERLMVNYFKDQYDWDPLIAAFSIDHRRLQEFVDTGVETSLYLTVYLVSKKMRREKSDFCVRDWFFRTNAIPNVEHLFILVIEDFMETLALRLLGGRERDAISSALNRLDALGSDKEKKWGTKIMNFIDSGEPSKFSVRFRFAMNAFEIFLLSQANGRGGVRTEASDYRDPKATALVASKMKDLVSKTKKPFYKDAIPMSSMNSIMSMLREVTTEQSMTINAYKVVISKVVSSLYSDKHELIILCKT